MRNILTIAITDLRVFFAQRGNLVGLLLIPVVLATILGVVSLGGSATFRVGVLDLDQSEMAQQFISEIFVSNERFVQVTPAESDAEALRIAVAEGNYEAALVVPAGFEAALTALQPVEIAYFSREAATSPAAIGESVAAVVGRWNGAVVAARTAAQVGQALATDVDVPAVYLRASELLEAQPVVYQYTLTESEAVAIGQGFEQSVPGMGSTFVMFTVLAGLGTLVKERQQWTLQRLVMLPLRRQEIIAGKILTYFTLGMIQFGVLFLVGLAFRMNFGGDLLALLLVAAAFVLAVTALTFALANYMRSEEQAGQLVTLLSLSMASLGGAWWPLEIVPDFMKTIAHISPVAWAMDGFHSLIYYGGGLIDVLPYIGVLLAMAAVLFVIGVRGFRYE